MIDKPQTPAAATPSMTDDANGEAILEIRFPARADRLKRVRRAVLAAATRSGCSEPVAKDIVIAVDEACQNIIVHAYGGAPDGEIVLEFRRVGPRIVVLLRDFAKTVDVNRIKPRDLEDLRPGGLGTHFIREVMDEVEFVPPPTGHGNLLRMVKRIG